VPPDGKPPASQAHNLAQFSHDLLSNLPRADLILPIAQALGVSPEEILGQAKPKRAAAPGGKVRSVFEQVQKLPRRQQDKIIEVVEALLKAG
jgi:hypothetical protein